MMKERYIASMVLHGCGDSMGYYGGHWEFMTSGSRIQEELKALGGVNALKLEPKNWPVSDDTVLHLAVAENLTENKDLSPGPALYKKLVVSYKNAMKDMVNRAPGNTTMDAVHKLSYAYENGHRIPFNPRGGGCGASMRASCIGLRYPNQEQLDDLLAYSIESGRMTHHLPLGYLGSFTAALFTSFAIQGKPVENWGIDMINTLPKAQEYIKKEGYCVNENLDTWKQFQDFWVEYLKDRKIDSLNLKPIFPEKYGVNERDQYYKLISKGGWPGAMGVDSVIIAYDALLGSKDSWEELMLRAALHGGDSDSTGSIAGSWFGAIYGFKNVDKNNYEKLEYLNRLKKCGEELFKIAQKVDE